MANERVSIDQELIKDWWEAFRMFDKDGDGTITVAELDTVVSTLGQDITEQELKKMIEGVDKNGNGTIEFEEFCQFMQKTVSTEQLDAKLRSAFQVFDRDGNGFICASELKYVMSRLGEKITADEINDMIKEADLDGDGRINYEEFVRMMKKYG